MNKIFIPLLLSLVIGLLPGYSIANDTGKKPRVIIMTDGEIDDQSSMIRFLLYTCDIDLEAIIETNSLFQRHGHSKEDWFEKQVAAYAQVYPNLIKHNPNYPTADYIRSKSFVGDEDVTHLDKLFYWVQGPGHAVEYMPDNWPNTPGSDKIVQVLLDPDPSPVYIQAWGGGNTASKAFYKLKKEFPADYDRAISKVVMYNIWYQDDAGNYIETYHPKVRMIYNNSFFGTWDYNSLPHTTDLVTHHIKNNHGPLGALYPQTYISEGDTPALLHTVNTGLRDYEYPNNGGWGGRFSKVANLANVYKDAHDDGDVKKSLKRWITQANADFQARMDWSAASSFSGANHHPRVQLNVSENITVKSGQTVSLSAEGTTDPDGNGLSYRWWQYKEAGSYPDLVTIQNATSKTASLVVPTVTGSKTMHVILEVTDNGSPALVSYKRIVLTLVPNDGVTTVPPATGCTATGTILREQWNNITGTSITAIPLNTAPASTQQLNIFEGPSNVGDNYGSRIRGYVCAPVTGNYTFYIAGDDNSELWLSTDENPANKHKIASLTGYTHSREWAKFSTQKSVAISLQAGRRYYIEALHKEGNGGDNLAVGWQFPNGTLERPIAGNRLSPFVVTTPPPTAPIPTPTTCNTTGTILREQWNNIAGTSITAIPLNNAPSSSSQLTLFEGPTNTADNYGSRIRGYICAPLSGSYTFFISGDDNSELWLSTDENPANKRKIASLTGYTHSREWAKFPTQKSVAISLQAGRRYYIEALHKEGVGGDNLAVGWQLPNGTLERPIAGNRLATFVVTTPPPTTTACTATGTILREQWNNISGASISAIPFNVAPSSTSQLTSFEGPTNAFDNYGSRIRGYVCAPVTGNYTFFISGDDNTELWLSTDDNPANKRNIAGFIGWTLPREWSKYASQKSVTIPLVAGRRYYIEALQKDDQGWDNLAVGWQLPNGTLERPIGGNRLSPFVPSSNTLLSAKNPANTLLEQVVAKDDNTFGAYPNPFQQTVNLTFTLPAAEPVEVQVYTLQGVLLETVYKGISKAGQRQEVAWDGSKYATGIYLAKISHGKEVVYKRLLLQR